MFVEYRQTCRHCRCGKGRRRQATRDKSSAEEMAVQSENTLGERKKVVEWKGKREQERGREWHSMDMM